MGRPVDSCFDTPSIYDQYSNPTTTTTTTTLPPEVDFFVLPDPSASCPTISFDTEIEDVVFDNPDVTYLCYSPFFNPSPCIIILKKYIRVADINIDVDTTDKCQRFMLRLINQSFFPKFQPTTTTLAPGATTTTLAPGATTTTLAPFNCNYLRYPGNVTQIQNYGTYSIGRVTASYGGAIWGTNQYGYTDDSSWNAAVIHAGVLLPGQTGFVKFTFLGVKNSFPSSTANGITTSTWGGNWCAITLSLISIV